VCAEIQKTDRVAFAEEIKTFILELGAVEPDLSLGRVAKRCDLYHFSAYS
jgi:hypothetical protein